MKIKILTIPTVSSYRGYDYDYDYEWDCDDLVHKFISSEIVNSSLYGFVEVSEEVLEKLKKYLIKKNQSNRKERTIIVVDELDSSEEALNKLLGEIERYEQEEAERLAKKEIRDAAKKKKQAAALIKKKEKEIEEAVTKLKELNVSPEKLLELTQSTPS